VQSVHHTVQVVCVPRDSAMDRTELKRFASKWEDKNIIVVEEHTEESISSTMIRGYLKGREKVDSSVLHPKVEDYITKYELFRN
jgi:nicotinic acid mononucleotide adenylyltransferase